MTACSIVIPAHDEAGYIGACLDTILAQDAAVTAEVIVVANGCSDDTAARARALAPAFAARGWTLRVEELAQGGKIGALNHGDRCASHGNPHLSGRRYPHGPRPAVGTGHDA